MKHMREVGFATVLENVAWVPEDVGAVLTAA